MDGRRLSDTAGYAYKRDCWRVLAGVANFASRSTFLCKEAGKTTNAVHKLGGSSHHWRLVDMARIKIDESDHRRSGLKLGLFSGIKQLMNSNETTRLHRIETGDWV